MKITLILMVILVSGMVVGQKFTFSEGSSSGVGQSERNILERFIGAIQRFITFSARKNNYDDYLYHFASSNRIDIERWAIAQIGWEFEDSNGVLQGDPPSSAQNYLEYTAQGFTKLFDSTDKLYKLVNVRDFRDIWCDDEGCTSDTGQVIELASGSDLYGSYSQRLKSSGTYTDCLAFLALDIDYDGSGVRWASTWAIVGWAGSGNCVSIDVGVEEPESEININFLSTTLRDITEEDGYTVDFDVGWEKGDYPVDVEVEYGDGESDEFYTSSNYKSFSHQYDESDTYNYEIVVSGGGYSDTQTGSYTVAGDGRICRFNDGTCRSSCQSNEESKPIYNDCSSGICCFPKQCQSGADTDNNGEVILSEVTSYGNKWINNQITRTKMGQAIQEWANGC